MIFPPLPYVASVNLYFLARSGVKSSFDLTNTSQDVFYSAITAQQLLWEQLHGRKTHKHREVVLLETDQE